MSREQGSALGGILWMVTATVFFGLTNVASKLLGQDVSLVQIVWGRYFFHFLILALLLRGRLPGVLQTHHLGLQLGRSLMLLAASCLYFGGFILMPLADAAALLNISPVLVTLLAVPFLGEKVGIRRILGVAAGLTGALIIIRPGAGVFGAVGLLPVGAAVVYSFYQIATRKVSGDDSPTTSITYTALAGTVLASLAVPFFWVDLAPLHWVLLVSMGATGATGHYAMIRAYAGTEASIVAPFNYAVLIWMATGGYLLFGDVPDLWTWIGSAIIVVSGIYIGHREAKQRRATPTRPGPA
ncbi:MAG: DMT family transporter [Rhodospirillales bacterium]